MPALPLLRLPHLSRFSKGAHSISRYLEAFPSCPFNPYRCTHLYAACDLSDTSILVHAGDGTSLDFSPNQFVHQHRATYSPKVVMRAAPPPLPRFEHQRGSHRVLMNVVELFLTLRIGADHKIIEAALPHVLWV